MASTFFGVNFDPVPGDLVTQQLNFRLEKIAFAEFEPEPGRFYGLKQPSEVTQMVFLSLAVEHQVVHVDHQECSDQFLEDGLHSPLENGRSCFQTHGHAGENITVVVNRDGSVCLALFCEGKIVESMYEVSQAEPHGVAQVGQNFVNPWEWVRVIYENLIQLAKIHAKPNCPIWFRDNPHGAVPLTSLTSDPFQDSFSLKTFHPLI